MTAMRLSTNGLVAPKCAPLLVVAYVMASAFPCDVGAQTKRLVARADTLLAAGKVARAESLYYVASRRSTQDPVGRAALGKYLGARGAFKVGAVLLEEAISFGGDTAELARRRAPLLQAADDWMQLAQLARSPLTPAEKQRAEWLATHLPAVTGADSVTVAFEPSSAQNLGRVDLVVGGVTLAADIDPTIDELVIGDFEPYKSVVRVFSKSQRDRVAIVDSAMIGDLRLERIPARIDHALGPARARIGLTLLAKLAPTVDAGAHVLTLRRTGVVNASLGRRRVPVMFQFPGIRVARADRLVPIESAAGRAVLNEARWTLDIKRGELVLEVD
ncbi:MAG TPA: hypothetical protein VJR92_00490 [Gemmatimonadaceae bacterium]|nr:hypothetical protein [Gemmatimonadaceae bacterium]